MEKTVINKEPYQFSTKTRQQIYDLLEHIGPGPQQYFLDACRIADANEPFGSTTHLIAHLLREVENALLDVLVPSDKKANTSQAFQFLEITSDAPVSEAWLELARLGKRSLHDISQIAGADESIASTTHLTAHLLQKKKMALHGLLVPLSNKSTGSKSPSNHRGKIAQALRFLEIREDDPVVADWFDLVKSRIGLYKWAHRNSLLEPRQMDDEFQRIHNGMEAVFLLVLKRFEEKIAYPIQEALSLARIKKPTNANLKRLKTRIANGPRVLKEFFDATPSKNWLQHLDEAGYFSHPPNPKEARRWGIAGWPASMYLARLAESAPKDVLEIILAIPDTNNRWVHVDICDAALAAPTKHIDLIEQVAIKEITWLENQEILQHPIPEKIAELATYLAQSDKTDSALNTAKALLDLQLPDGESDNGSFLGTTELRARLDEHRYRRILKKLGPDLVAASGTKALSFLCDLLENAVRLSLPEVETHGSQYGSHFWRKAIEDHRQNRYTSEKLLNALVEAVRNAGETLLPTSGVKTLEIIEERPFLIFKRITLHLRRLFPDTDRDGTAKIVVNPELFDSREVHHEYYHLLQDRFGELPSETKDKYFEHITEGAKKESDPEKNSEDDRRKIGWWEQEKLWPIREYLVGIWRKKFDQLLEELGPISHPSFCGSYFGGLRKVPSPKDDAELRVMEIDALIEYLKEWILTAKISTEFPAPTPFALGSELRELFASDPKRYSQEASKFRELEPTYIRSFFDGLRASKMEEPVIDWAAVLDLCTWVVEQPRDIPNRTSNDDFQWDAHWGHTRQSIAHLLYHGFHDGPKKIPFHLRVSAWNVLKVLTEDPNPSPEYENEREETNLNPWNLTFNTVRGVAMMTVIIYADWVYWNTKQALGKDKADKGFDLVPEAREVLDRHLDPTQDISLAVRAAYGWWLHILVSRDFAWTKSNINRIFPRKKDQTSLRNSAWRAFLASGNFIDPDLIWDQYEWAVSNLQIEPSEGKEQPEYELNLSDLMMILLWRGKITPSDPDGLLRKFYSKASKDHRRRAISVLGSYLDDPNDDVNAELEKRLKEFIEWRLDEVKKTPDAKQELAGFGRWFASEVFDDRWSLEILEKIASMGVEIEGDREAIEVLAKLAEANPKQAMKCLVAMEEADRLGDGWNFQTWNDEVRMLLEAVMKSGNVAAIKSAEDFINCLIAHWQVKQVSEWSRILEKLRAALVADEM